MPAQSSHGFFRACPSSALSFRNFACYELKKQNLKSWRVTRRMPPDSARGKGPTGGWVEQTESGGAGAGRTRRPCYFPRKQGLTDSPPPRHTPAMSKRLPPWAAALLLVEAAGLALFLALVRQSPAYTIIRHGLKLDKGVPGSVPRPGGGRVRLPDHPRALAGPARKPRPSRATSSPV